VVSHDRSEIMPYECVQRHTELGSFTLFKSGFESKSANGSWFCVECKAQEIMLFIGHGENDEPYFTMLTDDLKNHYDIKHNN
jgi:hypothetical protein